MESDGYMEGTPLVIERNKEGEPLMSTRVIVMDLSEKKPFYNEFERMERLQKLIKETGNDQELGEIVRREYEI